MCLPLSAATLRPNPSQSENHGAATKGIQREAGVIYAAGDHDYPPYAYLDNGLPTGFEVEVARAAAQAAGLKIDIRLLPWQEAREAFDEGQVDMLTGMAYSPERDERYDFSIPITYITFDLFTNSGSSIRTLDDLAGQSVVVQQGGVMRQYVEDNLPDTRIVLAENPSDALRLLQSGHQQAALLNRVQALYLIERQRLNRVQANQLQILQYKYGFVVQSGNDDLLYQLNDGLNAIKTTGEYDQIYERWFGVYQNGALSPTIQYLVVLLTVLALVVLGIVLWNRALQRQVAARTAALSRSEERYRLLVNNSAEGILVFNRDELLFSNPRGIELFGYQPDETRLIRLSRVVTPEDRARLIRLLEERKLGEPFSIREPICGIRKDGRPVWFQAQLIWILWDQKPAVLSMLTDITEQWDALQALRFSEERFHLSFHTHPDAISVSRLSDGVIVDINEGFTNFTGYARQDIEGHGMTIARLWDNPAEAAQLHEKLKGAGSVKEQPALLRKKDGSLSECVTSVSLIQHEGQPCMLAITRDVTQQVQAQRSLEQSEKRYRALFDTAVDIVLLISDDGKILDLNEVACQALNSLREHLAGKPISYIAAPEEVDNITGRLRKLTGPGRLFFESALLSRDGRRIPVEFSARRFENSSGSAVLASARDITERLETSRQLKTQIEHLAAQRSIDMAIIASIDLPFTLRILLEQVYNMLKVDACSVLLFNPKTHELEHAADRGFRSNGIRTVRLNITHGYAGRAVTERRMVQVWSLPDQPDYLLARGMLAQEEFVSYIGVPLVAKGMVKGVLELFHRSPLHPEPEWMRFLEALADQAAIAVDNATLFEDLQRTNENLVLAYDATIEGWARALELRDGETEGHSQRVVQRTVELARDMGIAAHELEHIRRGALLHDIGKMAIPDSILLKPGPLTDQEWNTMRMHPVYAHEMLSKVSFLRSAMDIPHYHHERWDGSGYPLGLKGDEIPLAARIFAVVDIWDALASDRPYRPAWERPRIIAYLREQAGVLLDPEVVELFLSKYA